MNINLLLLPKEIQDLIGEFNVDHRPNMRKVMTELLTNHNNKQPESLCRNCGCMNATAEYTRYIYWEKYTFCSAQCQYELERDIRKK